MHKMAATFLPITLLCLLSWRSTTAYSGGPPIEACDSMTPNHGPGPQTSPPPYEISLGAVTSYTPGGTVGVRVQQTGSNRIKGILLQARRKDSTDIIGTFDAPPSGFKQMDCSGGTNNAVSHANGATKDGAVDFSWRAPSTDAGAIEFVVTVVEAKSTFWIGIKSITLNAAQVTSGTASSSTIAAGSSSTVAGGGNPSSTTAATTTSDNTAAAASTFYSSMLLTSLGALMTLVLLIQ